MLEHVIAAVERSIKAAPKKRPVGAVTSPGPSGGSGPGVTRLPAPNPNAGGTGRLPGPSGPPVGELPPGMIPPNAPPGSNPFTFGPAQGIGQQPTLNTNPPALNVRPLAPHEVPYSPTGYGPALGTPPPGAPPSGPVRQRAADSGSSLPVDPNAVAGEEDPWINRRAHQMKPGSPFYWHPPLITKKQLTEQGTGPPQQESVTIRNIDPNDPTQGGTGNVEHGHATPGGGQEQDNPTPAQTGGTRGADDLAARLGIGQTVSRGIQNVHGTYPYDTSGHGPTPKFEHENLMEELRLLKQQHPGFFQRTPGTQVVPLPFTGHFDDGTPLDLQEAVSIWLARHGEPPVQQTAAEQRAAAAAARAAARFQQQQQGGGRAPSTRSGGGTYRGPTQITPGPGGVTMQPLPVPTPHAPKAPKAPRAKRGSTKAYQIPAIQSALAEIVAAAKATWPVTPPTPAKPPKVHTGHAANAWQDVFGKWHVPGQYFFYNGKMFKKHAAPRTKRTSTSTSVTGGEPPGGSGGGIIPV